MTYMVGQKIQCKKNFTTWCSKSKFIHPSHHAIYLTQPTHTIYTTSHSNTQHPTRNTTPNTQHNPHTQHHATQHTWLAHALAIAELINQIASKKNKEDKKGGGAFRKLFGRKKDRSSKLPENAAGNISGMLADSTPAMPLGRCCLVPSKSYE